MGVPQNIKNITSIQFNSSTPGCLFEENKNTNLKRYVHLYVYSSIVYNNQDS